MNLSSSFTAGVLGRPVEMRCLNQLINPFVPLLSKTTS